MIPERTKDALDLYVSHRIQTGGFLKSVLSNDLMGAICRADNENLAALKEICLYVYNDMPSACWGSETKIKNWLSSGEYVEGR